MYFEIQPEERFRSSWAPVLDVYERAGEILVRVELPGVGKQDIRLRWKDNVLSITGSKHRQKVDQTGARYLCVERQHGRFRRDIVIHTPIDFSRCTAELGAGLLQIRLPKLIEDSGNSYIPIK